MQQAGLDKDKNVAWLPTGTVNEWGKIGTTQGLFTERIAELSARFCVDLMARGTPESSVSPPSQRSEINVRQTEPRRVVRTVHKTKTQLRDELHRKRVIFGAIQAGLEGKKYCAELDDRKLRLPDRWKEEGRPDTYTQAYKDKGLRKKIQDEKCRYRVQYEKTPAPEQEEIIQGESGTRRTRR
jgi:hypothetical protein